MIYTFDLSNKVILITGGYGYLGEAITKSLLFHKAIVYVLGKSETKFQEKFSKLQENYPNLNFEHCDVSNNESIKTAFSNIYRVEMAIDVLINNAFYSKGQSPEEMTDIDWGVGIDGTLNSVFRSIREVIPYFKRSKSGKVINVASMYGMVAPQFEVYDDFPEYLNPPHYGVAKAGILQLTRYYSSYLGKDGVQVNCITPGPFPSESVQLSAGFVEQLSKRTCLGRIGKPEDLAGAFVFLASDTSNFITGQNIVVDGGWTIK